MEPPGPDPEPPRGQDLTAALRDAVGQLTQTHGQADKLEVARKAMELGFPKHAVLGRLEALKLAGRLVEDENGTLTWRNDAPTPP